MDNTLMMDENNGQKRSGITGSTIKLIAIVTMLIDHIGATILERQLPEGMNPMFFGYFALRCIGRIAFPIFIFLLIEGFEHTHNRWKYFVRLVLFALISEIPFDWAFNLDATKIFKEHTFVEFQSQNVYFTLAIGMLTIILMDQVWNSKMSKVVRVILLIVTGAAGMTLGFLLKTDYGMFGVLGIVTMYLLRKKKILGSAITCVTLCLASLLEVVGFAAVLPIALYNGERGWKLKYLFYLFYPVHLLILAGICMVIGI